MIAQCRVESLQDRRLLWEPRRDTLQVGVRLLKIARNERCDVDAATLNPLRTKPNEAATAATHRVEWKLTISLDIVSDISNAAYQQSSHKPKLVPSRGVVRPLCGSQGGLGSYARRGPSHCTKSFAASCLNPSTQATLLLPWTPAAEKEGRADEIKLGVPSGCLLGRPSSWTCRNDPKAPQKDPQKDRKDPLGH